MFTWLWTFKETYQKTYTMFAGGDNVGKLKILDFFANDRAKKSKFFQISGASEKVSFGPVLLTVTPFVCTKNWY